MNVAAEVRIKGKMLWIKSLKVGSVYNVRHKRLVTMMLSCKIEVEVNES